MEEKKYGIWNTYYGRWYRGYIDPHDRIWQEPENPIPLTLEEAQEYARHRSGAEVREITTKQVPSPTIDLDKLAENIPDYHSLPVAPKKEPAFDFDAYNYGRKR